MPRRRFDHRRAPGRRPAEARPAGPPSHPPLRSLPEVELQHPPAGITHQLLLGIEHLDRSRDSGCRLPDIRRTSIVEGDRWSFSLDHQPGLGYRLRDPARQALGSGQVSLRGGGGFQGEASRPGATGQSATLEAVVPQVPGASHPDPTDHVPGRPAREDHHVHAVAPRQPPKRTPRNRQHRGGPRVEDDRAECAVEVRYDQERPSVEVALEELQGPGAPRSAALPAPEPGWSSELNLGVGQHAAHALEELLGAGASEHEAPHDAVAVHPVVDQEREGTPFALHAPVLIEGEGQEGDADFLHEGGDRGLILAHVNDHDRQLVLQCRFESAP